MKKVLNKHLLEIAAETRLGQFNHLDGAQDFNLNVIFQLKFAFYACIKTRNL